MADKKISALTAATTPLAGTEVLPIVQSGATVKVAVSDLTTGRAVSGTTFTGTAAIGFQMTAASNQDYRFALPGVADWRLRGNYSNGNFEIYDASNTRVVASATLGGNFAINVGNLIQGTAAKGVDFSANTPLAGKTSTLLNWYEEGTWTPAPNSGTFSSATGRYTRIGRVVTLQFNITVGTGGGTNMTAPFTCAFNANAIIYTEGQTYPVGATSPQVLIGNGGTTINFVGVGSTLGFTSMTLSASAVIIGCLTYTV